MWNWWLNALGLGISFLGSILLYLGSARDTVGYERMTTLEANLNQDDLRRRYRTRATLSRWGFICLIVGFFLQLISMVNQIHLDNRY
jgi:hypothetical protein